MSMHVNAENMFIVGDKICICYGGDDNGNNYVDVKIEDIKNIIKQTAGRKCNICNVFFPLTVEHFYRLKTKGFGGFTYKCKTCDNKRKRNVKEYNSKYHKNWKKENKEKIVAQRLAYKAIKSGELTRPKFCEMYNLDNESCGDKIYAHHEDYSKPLDVMWLCCKHHKLRHRQLKEK